MTLPFNNGIILQWCYIGPQPTLTTIQVLFSVVYTSFVQVAMSIESGYDGYEYIRIAGYSNLSTSGFYAAMDGVMGVKRFIAIGK